MEFKLTVPIPSYNPKISYKHKILLAGSCFAENMGGKMATSKFNVAVNPNGIVYNPISIATQLSRCLAGNQYNRDELFNYNELWSSWQHHGEYSNTNKQQAVQQINKDFNTAKQFLQNGEWLIITFGSAYVYKLKSTGQIVANCHKYPNTEFTKELLSVDKVVETWSKLIQQLQAQNPKLKIIFTVSPVRYIRDGLVNNNLSKAILLQAVHTLCKQTDSLYFPAYELVIDELRDYRFFESDMLHPNTQAVEYVWQKFTACAFDDETKNIYQKLIPLVTAAKHRVLHKDTEAHTKFLAAHYKKVQDLKAAHPFLDLGDFENSFSTK